MDEDLFRGGGLGVPQLVGWPQEGEEQLILCLSMHLQCAGGFATATYIA